MNSVYFYEYPVGRLGIAEESGAITKVFFAKEKKLSGFSLAETPLIKKTASQLDEYFKGKRKVFNLPLSLKGTDFQCSVWEALQAIPYGKTCCYVDIAEKIGKPKACRAVGMANNRNPIVIIVPCHRVIGKDSSLTGYGGGLGVKKYLLDLEKSQGYI
jgi:methylated-DNA-[protein]-cysteine S-methyltransferase